MQHSKHATPTLLIVLAMLEAERERKGAKWCRKHSIGPMRQSLRTAPANVVPIVAAVAPEIADVIDSKRAAQAALARVCEECRGCEWARRAA